MPTNKDFKRLVRARMEKTGEAYMAARLQLLRAAGTMRATGTARVTASEGSVSSRAEPAVTVPPGSFASLAGMSDAAVKKATGCNWERWVAALDYAGATDWSHRAIADYVRHAYKTPSWWTQMVVVGYERIKGLRAKGQQRDGGYEATKSKTIAAPAARVYRAFTDARLRKTWLPGVKPVLRKSTPNRSVRMSWEDGTSVEVWLTSRSGKTTAQVQHRKLVDKADADQRRAFWAARLSALQTAIQARP